MFSAMTPNTMLSAKTPNSEKINNDKEYVKEYVKDYLELLKLEEQLASIKYLSKLMKAHLYTVPFDGSSLTLHKPEEYVLDNRQILAKFKEGKGAICYQANGAFKELLTLLGFKASLVSAKMLGYETEDYVVTPTDAHCAILVELDKEEYLVDVSWGNAFRRPLQVSDGLLVELDKEKSLADAPCKNELRKPLRVSDEQKEDIPDEQKGIPEKRKDIPEERKDIPEEKKQRCQTNLPGEKKRKCIREKKVEGDKEKYIYNLCVNLTDKKTKVEYTMVEYQFENVNKKTEEFKDNIIFLATSNDSDLYHNFLGIQRFRNAEWEYIDLPIYQENASSLFFNRKTYCEDGTILRTRTETTDMVSANNKLGEFGVTQINRNEILSILLKNRWTQIFNATNDLLNDTHRHQMQVEAPSGEEDCFLVSPCVTAQI